MPDAVELDPVGLGETLQVAGGGAGPREDAVVGAPNDPHRALDPVRVEGLSVSRQPSSPSAKPPDGANATTLLARPRAAS